MVVRDLMPAGLFGLLLASFLAAFMSTIASQTIWGTSYIINDLFKPFVKKNASEKYYVKISKITTFLLLLFSLIVTSQFDKITDAWKFVLTCGSGIGLVLIFRWFWWRINAWSEISAMLAPYLIFPILIYGFNFDVYGEDFPITLLIIVIWSSIVWITITFLTKPTDTEKLISFYKKIHPGGKGWRKISDNLPEIKGDKAYGYLFVNWITGCLLVIFTLFGIGELIFQNYIICIIYFAIALLSGILITRNIIKVGW